MMSEKLRRIGLRLRLARERRGLTQEDAARVLELKNRQSVSQIEKGERRIRPAELARLAQWLEVPVTYFTDRFEPTQEIAFSFRATRDDPEQQAAFEEQASRWLALFVELAKEQHAESRFLRRRLSLSERSSYEDAHAAAEEVGRELRLGEFPGTRLSEVLDGDLGIVLLHVDAPASISGAAANLDQLGVIMVNRTDSPGRRNFDVAHELFHLLTWDRMPPPRVEMLGLEPGEEGPGLRKERRARREQLADNFASALLMPAGMVERRWREWADRSPVEAVVALARRFRVSPAAFAWRLHNLGLIERHVDLPDDSVLAREAVEVHDSSPTRAPRFNREFVDRVRISLEDGTLSFRRAARILGLNSRDLELLFHSYGMASPYEA